MRLDLFVKMDSSYLNKITLINQFTLIDTCTFPLRRLVRTSGRSLWTNNWQREERKTLNLSMFVTEIYSRSFNIQALCTVDVRKNHISLLLGLPVSYVALYHTLHTCCFYCYRIYVSTLPSFSPSYGSFV